MLSLFMAKEFFELVSFVLKIGFKVFDEPFHFVYLVLFVMVFFLNFFEFFPLLVQAFLKIMLFLVNVLFDS
jgi:hypothetical protein